MSQARQPRSRSLGRAALLAAAVAGLLVIAGLGHAQRRYHRLLQPAGGEQRLFQVKDGEPVATIARRLAEAGLIRDAAAFRRRARQRDLTRGLKAGWYRVDPTQSADGVLELLASGRVATRKITFPEGFTIEQMAERCQAEGLCRADEYRRLATRGAGAFGLDGLPAGSSLEGYLFPDTYLLPMDAGARELIERQVNRFVQVWRELAAGLSPVPARHATVIKASLIEKEVKADEERAKVAGVIENRLARGMKLEFCATVLYALGEHKDRLLYRDLQVASPYNTYRVRGLPPGPIASPGRASLRAALHPARHDYLYYVLAADGRHLFSRSGAEHLRAKAAGERARHAP